MKAIILEEAGGVENLVTKEIPQPSIKPEEVLVEVNTISINPVDFKVRGAEKVISLIYGEERPAILGWDIAGSVVAIGEKVSDFSIGDKVFGMVNFPGTGKAYSEYVASPENHLAKIPANISFEEAAATTLAALTALQALESRVKSGDKVLIHAGAGGVGHFAIQIAKNLGAYVITTASAKNESFVKSLGTDENIDYRSQAFEEVISEIDFVLDSMGGKILENSIKVVKEGGSIICLLAHSLTEDILAEAKRQKINLSALMVQSNGDVMDTLRGLLESGVLKPNVSNVFTFEEMDKAHVALESGRTAGKVVVNLK